MSIATKRGDTLHFDRSGGTDEDRVRALARLSEPASAGRGR
jgi:hypothetical protein